MLYGSSSPQETAWADRTLIRDYAQALEGNGFDYMLGSDHVAGAARERYKPGAFAPFFEDANFHEVFVLFGYLAGLTTKLEFVPSVLQLPARQTALVAKQATEVDLLSDGRLRLGVGLGWSEPEYEAMGADFHSRGAQIDEQIEVLRLLWAEPLASFKGRYHSFDKVAIMPRSPRPLRLWIGSGSGDRQLRRVAKYADGWMALLAPDEDPVEAVAKLRHFAAEEGRDPASIGVEGRVGSADPATAVKTAKMWQSLGATHLVVRSAPPGTPPMEMLEKSSRMLKIVREELGE